MYALNTEAAKAADFTGNRIVERGKYIGRFTRAQHVISAQGTKGVDFDFEASNGQKARFSLYTIKADGTQIYGFKQLMAIMTVLKLRNLGEPQDKIATVYDFDAGKEVQRSVPQFAELLDQPIGLLFTMEEYKPEKWRPNLAGIFDAETELVASEILERKTQPLTLPKMIDRLRDKPFKDTSGAPAATGNAQAASEFDDDIPW